MSAPTPPTFLGATATLDDPNKGVPWGKLSLWQYIVLFLRSQAPAANAVAVTPHDTNAISISARALYVGTGGTTLKVRLAGADADVTFANVPDGSLLPIAVTHVRATGNDATDIIALG